jgi:hypothetical protein
VSGACATAGDAVSSRRASGSSWSVRSRWLALCAGVFAIFIALAVLGGFSSEPGGPASSSYATGARGVAAWATLLSRVGRSVRQLRAPLSEATLPPRETLILLEPDALLHSEGARLIDFVRAGGHLVYGSIQPQRTLPALLYTLPAWSAGGASRYFGETRAGGLALGVAEVRTAGEGRWTSLGGYRAPVHDTDGGALLLQRTIGRGTLVLVAEVSPLQNRLLGSADNAQLALNIAGPANRPVVFVESVHGYGQRRGLAALPFGWKLAFGGLGLAGLLWIAARWRRLGPPERRLEAQPPPRSDYADAVALLLRRTKDEAGVVAALDRFQTK